MDFQIVVTIAKLRREIIENWLPLLEKKLVSGFGEKTKVSLDKDVVEILNKVGDFLKVVIGKEFKNINEVVTYLLIYFLKNIIAVPRVDPFTEMYVKLNLVTERVDKLVQDVENLQKIVTKLDDSFSKLFKTVEKFEKPIPTQLNISQICNVIELNISRIESRLLELDAKILKIFEILQNQIGRVDMGGNEKRVEKRVRKKGEEKSFEKNIEVPDFIRDNPWVEYINKKFVKTT